MSKILYIIQLPPPIHGVTTVNKLVYESDLINKGFEDRLLLRVEYSQSLSDLSKVNFSKFIKMITLSTSLLTLLVKHKPNFAYYSIPPSGLGFYKEIANILLLKLFGVRLIFHLHGKGVGKYSSRRIDRFLYNVCFSNSVVIHLSKGLAESELNKLTLDTTDVYFAENGVPVVKINDVPRKVDAIQLLFLSNIQTAKGIFFLLENLSRFVKFHNNVRLNIIGGFRDSDTKRFFESEIVRLSLTGKIDYHGELHGEEKHKVIASCDVIVHPSFNDAFPLVLLEAMQHGLAVIASDQGAIPELVKPTFGIVFKTGDGDDLLAALRSISSDMKLLKEMQLSAKDTFYKKYTLDHFEERIADIFTGL